MSVTARAVLEDALGFHLNRLSPGEAADADTLAIGLRALNNIVDEWNGVRSFLFREIVTTSAAPITAATGTLGSTWAALSPGDKILGAYYSHNGQDFPLYELTMAQYQGQVAAKTTVGEPGAWAHDGLATIYFAPVPNSKTISLRTRAAVSEFMDIDTEYALPAGYRAALSVLTAEALAFVMLGGVPQQLSVKAAATRNRLAAQNSNPAIISHARARGSILTG